MFLQRQNGFTVSKSYCPVFLQLPNVFLKMSNAFFIVEMFINV